MHNTQIQTNAYTYIHRCIQTSIYTKHINLNELFDCACKFVRRLRTIFCESLFSRCFLSWIPIRFFLTRVLAFSKAPPFRQAFCIRDSGRSGGGGRGGGAGGCKIGSLGITFPIEVSRPQPTVCPKTNHIVFCIFSMCKSKNALLCIFSGL